MSLLIELELVGSFVEPLVECHLGVRDLRTKYPGILGFFDP